MARRPGRCSAVNQKVAQRAAGAGWGRQRRQVGWQNGGRMVGRLRQGRYKGTLEYSRQSTREGSHRQEIIMFSRQEGRNSYWRTRYEKVKW